MTIICISYQKRSLPFRLEDLTMYSLMFVNNRTLHDLQMEEVSPRLGECPAEYTVPHHSDHVIAEIT